jgi:two-component system CheB/CheR fusion protein
MTPETVIMTNNQPDISCVPPPTAEHAQESGDVPTESCEMALFPIVGVGASAGGLEAFTQLLTALPCDTGMAFVLVQHLSPTHASALSEILSRATKMPVAEVHDELTVEPNHVYVIPPARDMTISNGRLQLVPREPSGLHSPIDQFFISLAAEWQQRVFGVVLSGTASDGTIGLQAIKTVGGITFAQDSTAQHDGMPHSAIASGYVDFVLPPDQIAQEISRIGQHPFVLTETKLQKRDDKAGFSQIIKLLHHATGVDFSDYKFNTLYRRVTRRMVLQKLDNLNQYVEFLEKTPTEVEALYQDILISVTGFFRDPEAFEALKTVVFPRLLKGRTRHDPVRIWSLGCSTGQEAYSLAIAYMEAAEIAGSQAPLQVFATDLNAANIEKARAGVYSKDSAQDILPERLRQCFTEVDGGYRINKTIRDVCIFSQHNVLADAPFSRIDFISCRNVLIYMGPVLQQKVIPLLHYALKPAGCLWLGGSETIGGYRNLFEADDSRHRIYTRKPGASTDRGHFALKNSGTPRAPFVPFATRTVDAAAIDIHKEADRILLTKFAPPGVVVSADLEILQYRGDTGLFLTPAPGKASFSLLKMLREGLLVGVRAAILRAGTEESPVREEGLRVKSNDAYRNVAIEVIPLRQGGEKEGGFLVLFENASQAVDLMGSDPLLTVAEAKTDRVLASTAVMKGSDPIKSTDADSVRLEQELVATRDYLQSLIEEQESVNEELQSANEEVQSANEELQSTNEELETSKEEIQSSNEELATVNEELHSRNSELNRVNSDLLNLVTSIQSAVVMLGLDLRIRRFTPSAEKLLNLLPADIGRPLPGIQLNLDGAPDLESMLTEVISTLCTKERDVRDMQGHWYSLRLRPYLSVDDVIDGVVMMLIDVDVMKRAHEYTASIVATVREPLLVLDTELRVQSASRSFYKTFQVVSENTLNRPLFELGNGQWDIPDLRRLLVEVLPLEIEVTDFEMEHEFENIGRKSMRLNARRLVQAADQAPLILLAIEDITASTRAEAALRQSDERLQFIMDSMPQKIFTATPSGHIDYFNPQWADYTGMTIEELHDSGWTHFVHPDDLAEKAQHWQHAFETGEPFQSEHRFRDADGQYHWHLSLAKPLRDETGRILMWVGSNTNIDDIKQAEVKLHDSEMRYRRLYEAAKDGVLILNSSDGRIIDANPFMRELLGYSNDELLGKELWELGLFSDKVANESAVVELQRTGYLRVEHMSLASKDGSSVEVEVVANAYQEENHSVIQCNIRDITERSRMGNALREQAIQLSDLHRRKDEFLAMLSHELRSPLAPIANAVQLLGLQKSGENRIQQQARGIIERQVGRLQHLVDDLLEVSRLTTGRVQLRLVRVDVRSIAEGAVETVRPLIEDHRHELTVSLPLEPVWIVADAARLEQVVVNLLTNAAKYTEGGGHISLTVELSETAERLIQTDKASGGSESPDSATAINPEIAIPGSPECLDEVVIRVRDTGVGISPKLLPHIFDLFTQSDRSLDRAQGGLGIGLSLVKQLTELHGGHVAAFSTAGEGSEFVVRLPLVSQESQPASDESQNSSSLTTHHSSLTTPLKVLVVDDDVDTVFAFSMLLRATGHDVRTAHDGLAAVEAAIDYRPNVVVLDIGLPGLNGYEVAKRIRQQPDLKNTVLIALTGYGQDTDRQTSQEAGFDQHLVKPVGFEQLKKILTTVQEGMG